EDDKRAAGHGDEVTEDPQPGDSPSLLVHVRAHPLLARLRGSIAVSTAGRSALIAPSGHFLPWCARYDVCTRSQAPPERHRPGGAHPVASRPVGGDIFAKCSNPRKDQYTAAV